MSRYISQNGVDARKMYTFSTYVDYSRCRNESGYIRYQWTVHDLKFAWNEYVSESYSVLNDFIEFISILSSNHSYFTRQRLIVYQLKSFRGKNIIGS